jgi:hypothetical protein
MRMLTGPKSTPILTWADAGMPLLSMSSAGMTNIPGFVCMKSP